MLPKLENSFSAIKQGVKEVVIGNADQLEKIIKKQKHAGTIIRNSESLVA